MSLSKILFRSFLALVCLGVFAGKSHAQFHAAIQGTVMDSKGGAIAGAKVSATNVATDAARETVTSAEGFYRIGELPPGTYNVVVEAPGFKKLLSENVEVQAEEPRGLDVTLQVGGVAEQVTVSADTATLQTENANVTTTISTQEIEGLPQIGRDPYELLRIAPGVFGDGARAAEDKAESSRVRRPARRGQRAAAAPPRET